MIVADRCKGRWEGLKNVKLRVSKRLNVPLSVTTKAQKLGFVLYQANPNY